MTQNDEIFGPNLQSVHEINTSKNINLLSKDICNALKNAVEFIKFYNWCEEIESSYFGYGADGIIYLFLFKIKSIRVDVDPWIWVIVGDVPPAYLTCDSASNPYEALDSYLGAMEEWVEAAMSGCSVANLIPVNVPATRENAEMLKKRLVFLDERVLPALKNR